MNKIHFGFSSKTNMNFLLCLHLLKWLTTLEVDDKKQNVCKSQQTRHSVTVKCCVKWTFTLCLMDRCQAHYLQNRATLTVLVAMNFGPSAWHASE